MRTATARGRGRLMQLKKAVSLLTVVGIGCALGIAVMERRGTTGGPVQQVAGLAIQISAKSAFSAVVGTAIGGAPDSANQFVLLGDLDGREDLVADHALKVADANAVQMGVEHASISPNEEAPPAGRVLTRIAISEHTVANGFAENLFYYGDSVGNVTVGVDTNNDGLIDSSFVINLPTALNAFGSLSSDDQIVITGLAVSPVADLTSFSNVNGNYSSYAGRIGEILYVTFTDTTGAFRGTQTGALIRSGVLAFPVADITSAAPSGSGII